MIYTVLNHHDSVPAQEHYKYIKLITKAEENMHKHIQEYKYFLQDQDLDREAKEIGSKYITMIG